MLLAAYQLFINNWAIIIPISISIISLLISLFSFRRTSNYHKYEYAVRLQLADQRITWSPFPLSDAVLIFNANLKNKGLKPVEIIRVDFACGKLFDLGKCVIKTRIGRTHLSPGEGVSIDFKISGNEMLEIESKYGINQCTILVIVKYKDTAGTEVEKKELLGGFDEGNVPIFVLRDGDAVT